MKSDNSRPFLTKKNNRQVLAENTRGNVFQLFEDKPMWHDAWDIDLFYQEKQNEITALDSVEITEKGPLQFTMKQVLHSEKITNYPVDSFLSRKS